MKTLLSILFIVAFFPFHHVQSQQILKAGEAAESIEFDYFFKNLNFLASDELRGRNTGSEEYAIAAEYVAESFKSNGLIPLGDNGTFYQAVPFIEGGIDEGSIQFKIENSEGTVLGTYGENISLFIDPLSDKLNEIQELVFVGFGNISSKQGIDDYKGIDVKGKTVIVCLGGPKNTENPSFDNPFVKVFNAISKGAGGIILYSDKGLWQGTIFKAMHEFISGPRLTLADTSISKPFIDLDIVSFARKEFVSEILALDDIKMNQQHSLMKKGEFVSSDLSASVSCSFKIRQVAKDCKNIVALLPGSDPELKNEYIVLGAHLDHVGVGEAVKKDSIYNGMWDNATGVAAIMSIAKAFHDSELKPDRSIIFVSYTGEEKGLYGSKYFASKFSVTNGEIVANLNIDMLGGLIETKDITPIGYTHSNLSKAVDFATNQLSIKVGESDEAERLYIERSDQASFIKQGVPVLYLCGGVEAADPKIDAEKEMDKWMDKTYHSPFDDLNQEYSEEAFLSAIQVNFLALYYTANHIEKIKWNRDGWLYKKYIEKKGD